MIINYSPTGLIKDEKPMDLGKEFEEYYKSYIKETETYEEKYKENCQYCLEETLDSMVFYKLASKELKDEKIIYDIGANTNVQRWFFEQNGAKFIGIDSHLVTPKDSKFTNDMLIGLYPFNIKETNACAVSHLCLGFLIPLINDNIEYLKQFKTIIFEYAYITKEEIQLLEKYFKVEKCFKEYGRDYFKCIRKEA